MKHKHNKQITIGYDLNGKRMRKWIHADSIRELNEKTEKVKQEYRMTPNASDITFRKYAEDWFGAYKANRSARTQEMYRYAISKCSDLDRIRLKSVTKTICQQVVNRYWETPRTAKIVADTLRQIFRAAVEDGILIRNPAEGLGIPEGKPAEKHLLTEKELEAVKNAEMDPADRMFVTVLQVFGLRPAEAIALQVSDLDLKKKILNVNKAIELSNDNKTRIKDTKTGKARELPIPDEIIPLFRDHIKGLKTFLLFPKKDGTIMTKSAYRRMTERILGAINVALGGDDVIDMTTGITMYSFRHRRATDLYYLCQKGVISTKKAAELMGHSEEMFIRIYSHIDDTKEKTDEIYPNLKNLI